MASIPTQGNEMFTKLFISISSLWCRGKAGVKFHHLTRDASKNSAESRKQSVLTLVSLCLLREADLIIV